MASEGGGLLSNLFGSDKGYKPQYDSETLHGLNDSLANELSTNLGLNRTSLGDYSQNIAGNQPAVNDLVSRYTNLAKGIQGRANDPFANYKQIGDYFSGLINNNAVNPVINNLVNQLGVRRAVAGINPGIDSTADRLQRAGIASKVRLSALQDLMNNLTPASNALFNQRQMQDAASLNLAPSELALRNQAAGQALLPLYARNQSIMDSIAGAQAAALANKANIFGYKKDENFWDKAGKALDAVWGKAMDAYSAYSGGGQGGNVQSQPQFLQNQAGQVNPYLVRQGQINQGIGTPNYDQSYNRYLAPQNYGYPQSFNTPQPGDFNAPNGGYF